MRYKFGRFLQFIGLFVMLPLAIVAQVLEHISLGQMFLWTVIGMIVFYVGNTIQGPGK